MNAAVQPARALGGEELSNALRTGIHRLIAREEVINKINVFPVPDGDTGTNLALTLHAVLAALRASPERHAGDLLTRVADAALDGARGNSGAILAQFLLGVGDRAALLPALTTAEFAEALAAGAAYARESLAEPREGTILTVIGAFAEAARPLPRAASMTSARCFARRSPPHAFSLEETPSLLEMLRRANVVDAGALGFVELVSGMTDFLDTGIAPADDASIQLLSDDETTAGSQVNLEHRYCTECTITGSAIDRRRLGRRRRRSARASSSPARRARCGCTCTRTSRSASSRWPRASARSAARRPTTCNGSRRWRTTPRAGASPSSSTRRPTCRNRCWRRSTSTSFRCACISARRASSTKSACRRTSSSGCWLRARSIRRPRSRRPGDFRRAFEFLGRTTRRSCTSD
jgi:hypothetical protein